MLTLTYDEYTKIVDFTKLNFGIDLNGKQKLIETRLSPLLEQKKYKNFGQYFDILFSDTTGREIAFFLNKITTNHTYFMREGSHFQFLMKTVLPYLKRANNGTKDIRIWSAGCSSGQEAYTLAMFIDEFFGANKANWDTTILASDISLKSLKKAKKGIYTKAELDGLPYEWITNYFHKNKDDTYTICDYIKKEVVFKPINLMSKFSFQKNFDLIFCRNVMIYYDSDTRLKLVNRFYDVTNVNGYLFIGHSEIIDKSLCKYKYVKPAIYIKEKKWN